MMTRPSQHDTTQAMKNGRKDFTRAEAFRLAGKMYKLESCREELIRSGSDVKDALDLSLGGGGIGSGKTKRLRDIVACVQQMIVFCTTVNTAEAWKIFQSDGIKKGLKELVESEKSGLSGIAAKITSDINEGMLVCEDEAKGKETTKGKAGESGGASGKKKKKKKKN